MERWRTSVPVPQDPRRHLRHCAWGPPLDLSAHSRPLRREKGLAAAVFNNRPAKHPRSGWGRIEFSIARQLRKPLRHSDRIHRSQRLSLRRD
jgi:hypothetical protein